MTPAARRRPAARLIVATGLLASAAALAVPRTAVAADYDGRYTVDVTTDVGSCDKTYRGSVSVEDGRVASADGAAVETTGLIDRTGMVQLAIHYAAQVAHVSGQMHGRSGTGVWSSPTKACGGHWRAERLG